MRNTAENEVLRSNSLVTAGQLAELLQLKVKTIYSLVQQRKIPFIKISNRLRFHPDDVVKLIRKNRVPSLEE
jgi:excisionase family DNA binding protein